VSEHAIGATFVKSFRRLHPDTSAEEIKKFCRFASDLLLCNDELQGEVHKLQTHRAALVCVLIAVGIFQVMLS
jgi:hypothetical protein